MLPIGWIGRPYDSSYRMNEVQISDDTIVLKFENCRSLFIKHPQKIFLTPSTQDTWLTFEDFQEARLEWVDFGDEEKVPLTPKIKVFTSGKIDLVGFFKI